MNGTGLYAKKGPKNPSQAKERKQRKKKAGRGENTQYRSNKAATRALKTRTTIAGAMILPRKRMWSKTRGGLGLLISCQLKNKTTGKTV